MGSNPTVTAIQQKENIMLKPGPNYRMSAQSKRFLATIIDPHKRGEFKRSAIQAELAAAIQPRISKGKRDSQGE